MSNADHTLARCASLDEVRSNIDRLDREIVRLLAERGKYVLQAARFKKTKADVHAPERVEQVSEYLDDGTQYELPDPDVKLPFRLRQAIIREAHRLDRDGAVRRRSAAEDVAVYQGTRSKPIEWRCQKCRRTARPTAKQAETIAHALLSSGESRVDLIALVRTLGN